jgi:hypothetical protein
MVIFAGAAESTQPGGQATYLQVVVPQFPPSTSQSSQPTAVSPDWEHG